MIITNHIRCDVEAIYPDHVAIEFEPWGFSRQAISRDLKESCLPLSKYEQDLVIVVAITGIFFGNRAAFVLDELQRLFPTAAIALANPLMQPADEAG